MTDLGFGLKNESVSVVRFVKRLLNF